MNLASPLASLAFVGVLVLQADAQKLQADRRTPVDVSIAGGGSQTPLPYQVRIFCVQRIADQANGGCLQASMDDRWPDAYIWVPALQVLAR